MGLEGNPDWTVLDGGMSLPDRCPSCGSDNPAGYRFCRRCGREALPKPPGSWMAPRIPLPPPPPPPGPPPVARSDLTPPASPIVRTIRPPQRPHAPFRASDLEGESALYAFLDFNAFDRFDVVALNSINLSQVVQEADRRDRGLPHQVRHVAESLASRVQTETGDREEVAQLLRDLCCHWYLESVRAPTPPGGRPWKLWASEAWGGLFYESRVTGGWRKPRLADRLLWASRGKFEPEPGLRDRIFHRGAGLEDSESLNGRSREELLILRVAQAILDDLASTSRSANVVVALPHLDDLAGVAGSREVNSALQSLFHTYDEASFLFLDPNRNPEVGLCTLHWPVDRRGIPSTQYQLVLAPEPSTGSAPAGPSGTEGRPTDLGPDASGWYLTARSPEEWATLFTALDGRGARLPSPPAADCRRSPGYRSLRDGLLHGPPLNALFAKVQWKGRPTDLTLLNVLLSTGAFLPEVETDGGYLEAELNDLVSGDPRVGGDAGLWKIPGDRIVHRTMGPDGSPQYRITVESASSAAAAPG